MSDQQKPELRIPEPYERWKETYLIGYRAGREMNGGYRLNLEAMRYEPEGECPPEELAAWTEGFRQGYIERREAGETVR